MPTPSFRHPGPKTPPEGLERERAILRHAHEREMCRLHGRNWLLMGRARNALSSDAAGKRKSAARILGRLRYVYSYEPLVHALARECEPDRGDRAAKAAILRAMDKTGSEHCGQKTLTYGRGPLKEFMMAHLDDHVLVRAALKALRWTGPFGDAIHDLDEVKDAARSAAAKEGPDAEKYKATAAEAADLYFDWIRPR